MATNFDGVEISRLSWRKSTFSPENPDACVEVAVLPSGGRAVRDSKLGAGSPILGFTGPEWVAFVKGAKDGQFD